MAPGERQEKRDPRVTEGLMVCQVSQETRDTEETEGSRDPTVQSESQERRVLMDQLDQEDNQENLELEGWLDQEAHLDRLANRVSMVWMEFKAQRETWDHLGRLDPRVNKEILDYRA